MKRVAFLLPVLLMACEAREPRPDGVLDRERFTRVMVGMTLIEARLSQEMMTTPPEPPPMAAYYEELFAQEGIDSAAFRLSFDHYAGRPDEMKAIHEDVVERLRRMKDGADQLPLANDTTLATDSSSVRNR
jgi:hypothetical protein